MDLLSLEYRDRVYHCFYWSACHFRSSSFYKLVQLAQVSNFATTRVAKSILYQLQSYLPTNTGKNDAKTIFTFWRLEKIFRWRIALFASDISEFNLKRNVAKPAVVTRTFFRHLNIVALKVCQVDNTCIICFCQKWILSSGKELLHFHWLTIHFRRKRSSDTNWGRFWLLEPLQAGSLFILPCPLPPWTFSHRILSPILLVCNESKMAAKLLKDEKHQQPPPKPPALQATELMDMFSSIFSHLPTRNSTVQLNSWQQSDVMAWSFWIKLDPIPIIEVRTQVEQTLIWTKYLFPSCFSSSLIKSC